MVMFFLFLRVVFIFKFIAKAPNFIILLIIPFDFSLFSMRSRMKRKPGRTASDGHDATSSLGMLVRQMNEEVKLSEQTTQILTTSSGILRNANNQLDTIGYSIRSGGSLVKKYARRETTDKILLLMALLLYFGVTLYILKKRMLFSFIDLW